MQPCATPRRGFVWWPVQRVAVNVSYRQFTGDNLGESVDGYTIRRGRPLAMPAPVANPVTVVPEQRRVVGVDVFVESGLMPHELGPLLDGLVESFTINWVWMPPWGPDKITDDGREMLRALARSHEPLCDAQGLSMTLTLDPDQHQRHVAGDWLTAGNRVAGLQIEQLTGRHQITFAALQRAKQLILGFGNDLEADFLTVTGMAVEILLERAQTMVLDANGLALDFTGTIAALVDQYPQNPTAADLRQVADLSRSLGFRRPRQARHGRQWQ